MGGRGGGRVGSGVVVLENRTSPRRAAIEKAQAELRVEFDVRQERRRELEFLEKGGNPLDYKLRLAASVSLQSTSLTDQPPEHCLASEARGSFVLTASPNGDSAESSGRLGALLGGEPNTADNLSLFVGDNDIPAREKSSSSRKYNVEGSQNNNNARESEDSVGVRLGFKNQAYARRNRPRSSRNSGKTHNSVDTIQGGNRSSTVPLSSHQDGKLFLCEVQMDKNHSVSDVKPTSANDVNGKMQLLADRMDMEVDDVQAPAESSLNLLKDLSVEVKQNTAASEKPQDNEVHHSFEKIVGEDPNSEAFAPSGKRAVQPLVCLQVAVQVGESKNMEIAHEGLLDYTNEDGNGMENEKRSSHDCALGTVTVEFANGLDSESSCTLKSLSCNGGVVRKQNIQLGRSHSFNGSANRQALTSEKIPTATATINDIKECVKSSETDANVTSECNNPVLRSSGSSDVQIKIELEISESRSDSQLEKKHIANARETESQSLEERLDNYSGHECCPEKPTFCSQARASSSSVPTSSVPSEIIVSRMECPTVAAEPDNHGKDRDLKMTDKVLQDEFAREIPLKTSERLTLKQRKSHWDFVLEEMAWLAHDFMQERIWKIAAAAQVCQWVASRCQLDERKKKVAQTLANAVMHFWHVAEVIHSRICGSCNGLHEVCSEESSRLENEDDCRSKNDLIQDSKHVQTSGSPLQGYALRFLQYHNSQDTSDGAEAPVTPEQVSDARVLEISWDDQCSDETLFYMVPQGAMDIYRSSTEVCWASCEKPESVTHREDSETFSWFDAAPDFGAREIAVDEDEGETEEHCLPSSFDGSKSSKTALQKKKGLPKFARSGDARVLNMLSYGLCSESKYENQPLLAGKRASSSLNVGSIPTKRIRTAASRQRILGPFGMGTTGGAHAANKTDASSGDTSSFQDEHSALHGGSHTRRTIEVDSTVDCRKQLPVDCSEVSTKSKKKKKIRHMGFRNSMTLTDSGGLGSEYESRWLIDSIGQHQQRDHSKKMTESHLYEANVNSGVLGAAKKSKLAQQSQDTSPETTTPATASMPSPVASQMSNMSNPNKLIRMIASQDRSRKPKTLKLPPGQPGSGAPWSTFEDQALVVLVHDMGPNWELVSNAINTTLQFKCVFRKPKECKERHKNLMDRNSGDGADSGEDSGSSEPYPSTLPGIPKGSARQLFQRLQGPMEEDILKAHFKKIILIGRHSCRGQIDNQEHKQSTPVHHSHAFALSLLLPNGGCLTPLDLSDTTIPSPEPLPHAYQGSHSSGLANLQGAVGHVQSTSASASILQVSGGAVLGNGLPSPPGAFNTPTREVQRYPLMRPTTSITLDEQQRMQQYNQLVSSRNILQPNLAAPNGLQDCGGVRMSPPGGGNNMGIICGLNQLMPPMQRPGGYQGMNSPPAVISGPSSMLSASGMPNPINVHLGQGSSISRPREALHILRASQTPEDRRQMIIQELQLQGNVSFNNMSAPFSNQMVSPSPSPPPLPPPPAQAQTFPLQQHNQQPSSLGVSNHHSHQVQQPQVPSNQSQSQAYMLRLAKERQQQQRLQQQFTSGSPLSMAPHPHLQHPQHVILQQQQAPQPPHQPLLASSSSPTPSISNPISSQQKHQLVAVPPGGHQVVGPNQMLKHHHRQRQQQLQQHRQHQQQQQRQQAKQQQQLMKGPSLGGGGRGGGNIMKLAAIDTTTSHHLNGLSAAGSHQVAADKGELSVIHNNNMMQNQQHLFTAGGSGPNSGKHSMMHHVHTNGGGGKVVGPPPPAAAGAIPPAASSSSSSSTTATTTTHPHHQQKQQQFSSNRLSSAASSAYTPSKQQQLNPDGTNTTPKSHHPGTARVQIPVSSNHNNSSCFSMPPSTSQQQNNSPVVTMTQQQLVAPTCSPPLTSPATVGPLQQRQSQQPPPPPPVPLQRRLQQQQNRQAASSDAPHIMQSSPLDHHHHHQHQLTQAINNTAFQNTPTVSTTTDAVNVSSTAQWKSSIEPSPPYAAAAPQLPTHQLAAAAAMATSPQPPTSAADAVFPLPPASEGLLARQYSGGGQWQQPQNQQQPQQQRGGAQSPISSNTTTTSLYVGPPTSRS
ncbi:chromatin modification-related protein EAF1 B [Amborella trichopoda]|uniref:chromatin modification-related protein EAF1 B n=1 Tax=Amborella trichopoda TaxID=13333 RepID=UPI0009BE0194|nr:chromatin modification-related protein EAF1 B [Amborella trichopoda]XP_020525108.1 chromatin modification-related protein EAF1 B [Amborella trichopoda]XP_020525109.1 chromatin modification-related protein EAF1 B [Amborella trichopoda]XP_020525110.1 chromatin modification-related protein EAF1 B [Amborella trichopoda]XP_020525111.1 chromatin modification-related protein EAF1 B [Amborella trichopoda]|eukprot:XP_020525107.1 chromatin modification-related protein EAF1 B [Amborella trichopoda]